MHRRDPISSTNDYINNKSAGFMNRTTRNLWMAEGEGFEPPFRLPGKRFSRPPP